jgi:hypothetical protein
MCAAALCVVVVQGTPVWRQLAGLLEGSPRLAPALLRQLRANIKHLQHKVEEQQTTITQLKLLSQHGD